MTTPRMIQGTPQPISTETLIASAAQIVGAYVMNRPQESINLTALMADVYATLRHLAETEAQTSAQQKPIVKVEESVHADYIVCLEDGKRVKMLKRHLKTVYGLSPDEYRARWNLPATYPMVAPNYAKVRSTLAKQIGLGRRGLPAVKQRMNAAVANLR